MLVAVTILVAAGLGVGFLLLRQLRCRHRFGLPTSGYVCCLRCTRRFPIEVTEHGEWRIGKEPLAEDGPLGKQSH